MRADASKHKGDFRRIIEGVNQTLDAVLRPLNIAADYFERIGKGEIPEKSTTQSYGDIITMQNNMNACIDGLNGLVEANATLKRMAVNDHSKGVEGNYPGLFGEVKVNVNTVRERVIHVAGSIEKIGAGDLSEYPDYHAIGKRSEQDRLVPGFIRTLEHLQGLTEDAGMLAKAAIEGRLGTRADASRHEGEYRKIVEGVNKTLDAVIEPVNEAMRVANEFAQYNYTARIDKNLRVAGDFVRFRDALDNIGITVSAAIGEISVQVTDLAASAEEANASVEEVVSGAQQVAESAGKVSSNAEKGNQGLEQVLKAMEDLSAAIEEVTANTEAVATLANNANVNSKDGAELARKAEQGMVGITRSTTEVDKIIGEIKSEMQKIGKIVGLISDLASQTNLLALNAAIEAARAGDAGRGFAVVAAEVKSLAQESRTSAESIAEMIGGLQQKSEMAAQATASASKEVGEGSAVLSKTLNVFNRIVGEIEKITRSVEEVASASEEQAATVEEITASVHEVSTLVNGTASDAGDAAAASEESSAAIDEVGKIVENLNVIVDKVSSGISKFRV